MLSNQNNRGKITFSPVHAQIDPKALKLAMLKKYLKLSFLVIGIVFALLIVNDYVIGIFNVNGISMQPTFKTGQWVIVWKLPQTWAHITNSIYLPKRYDIVVINDQNSAKEQLIKRVIGLPGDTVSINNNIRIYNQQHPGGFNPNQQRFAKELLNPVGVFRTNVGPGQVFLMGDNRQVAASIDSRSSLGNIPSSDIIGKVILRFYPFSKLSIF